MEGECGASRSIIDGFHSFDIQLVQMEEENDGTRKFID